MPGNQVLAGLVAGSLRLTYVEGAVSHVAGGYSTGWRTLPFAVVSQWRERRMRIEVEGSPPLDLPPRQCLLMPAGCRHRTTVVGRGAEECRWAHVQAVVLGAHDLFTLLALPLHIGPPAADALGDTCRLLAAMPAPGVDLSLVGLARRAELHARLFGQLAALATAGAAWTEALDRADRVLPALAHIDAHWAEPLDSPRLAAIAGLSRSRFHAVFAAATGMAPMDYVRRRRMAEAQRLLAVTPEAVARVGERVGYPDQFHFSRVFKAATGSSPAAFRRAIAAARAAWGGAVRD